MSLEEWKNKLERKTELKKDDLPKDGDDWEPFSTALQQTKTINEVYQYWAALTVDQCKGLANAISINKVLTLVLHFWGGWTECYC